MDSFMGIYVNENNEQNAAFVNAEGDEYDVPLTNELRTQLGLEVELQADLEINVDSTKAKKIWSRDEINMLISEYKDIKHKFDGTTYKNESLWKAIAENFHKNGINNSASQCKFKFKSLKRTYHAVKDNNNRSGAANKTFQYYQQFEEIFGRSHNVVPLAMAESSVHIAIPGPSTSSVAEENEIDLTPVPRKRSKMTNAESIINKIDELGANREARHKEKQEQKKKEHEELLETLKESNRLQEALQNALINFLNK